MPLLSLSGTKWLAHGNCVTRVLQQWEALKTHFQEASNVCDKYVAREVLCYVCNLSNELYFTFLELLLHEFNSINLLFQKDKVDHVTIIDNLENLILQMLQRIVLADHVSITIDLTLTSIYLPINQVNLGFEFNLLVIQILSQNKISTEVADTIKRHCQQLLITAFCYLVLSDIE